MPTTVAPAGTSRVTTAPAPTTAASPTTTPGQQDRAGSDHGARLDRRPGEPPLSVEGSVGALSLAIATIVETNAPSPIVVPPVTWVLSMIFTSSPTVTS